MKSLKESMESKYDKEIELAKELTKQKEQETKQKELENVKYNEETKQKELELEIKRMEFQLEMRKLDLQYQVQVQQVIVPEIQVIVPVQNENVNVIPVVNQNAPRRRDVSDFYNTIEQKNLFIDWIRLNICTKQKVALNWADVTYKYLGYKTSPLINSKLRVYFEEYIKDTYPNIKSKYLSFTFMKKKINGWRDLAFTE
jgi:hypothetical protein